MIRRPSGLYAPDDYMVPIAGGADFPLLEAQVYEDVSRGSNTLFAAESTVSSINTKGAWVQLVAATTYAVSGVHVYLNPDQSGAQYLVDIGVGTAGSEEVVISNIYCNTHAGDVALTHLFFPIDIPVGTRLAVRHQCSTTNASAPLTTGLVLFGGGFTMMPGLSHWASWGAITASSQGTQVDPGGTANTKGSWVEFQSSTPRHVRALVFAVHKDGSTSAQPRWWVDVGVGASGSEVTIVPNLPFHAAASAGRQPTMPSSITVPVNIPPGTRVALRAQCNVNAANSREIRTVLFGGS